MINREKISPLTIVGICILIISIIGLIVFTLGLEIGAIQAIYYFSYRWLLYTGIIAGGILLFLGIFFRLNTHKSKGLLLILSGIFLLVFIIYAFLPMIINAFIYPADAMNAIITIGLFLVAPINMIIFGSRQVSAKVTTPE